MLLLSNMVLIQEQLRSFDHSPFLALSLTHKNCGLIFCFAKPLTGKCSAKILRLKVAKLRLNFCILSQNCDWNCSLISSPEPRERNCHTFYVKVFWTELFLAWFRFTCLLLFSLSELISYARHLIG